MSLRIDILTLFPAMVEAVLNESILKKAQAKKKVSFYVHNIRDYALDRHRTCDDRPFGGGPGMVMKAEPIERLSAKILKGARKGSYRYLYLSAQGRTFNQSMAEAFSKEKRLILLCGHYEGVDERIIEHRVTDEVSVGDYVLTGGELAALTVVDATVRLIPGVLGNDESKNFESFSENLLEYPHYTRPAVFKGMPVPPILLTGNHKAIESWRKAEALKRTIHRRPDLVKRGNKPGIRGK